MNWCVENMQGPTGTEGSCRWLVSLQLPKFCGGVPHSLGDSSNPWCFVATWGLFPLLSSSCHSKGIVTMNPILGLEVGGNPKFSSVHSLLDDFGLEFLVCNGCKRSLRAPDECGSLGQGASSSPNLRPQYEPSFLARAPQILGSQSQRGPPLWLVGF